jgi:hypothetical protein
MDNPNLVDAVAAKLEEIAVRRKAVAADLAKRQAEAANPVSESWGRARAAGKALADDDSDGARERYREAVRRAVDGIWVVVAPAAGGAPRVAAVQVWFKSGAHRDYLIGYRPARGRQKGETFKPASLILDAKAGEMDFRKPADAALVARFLARPDVRKVG